MSRKNPVASIIATCITLILMIPCVSLLLAFAVPDYLAKKMEANETETKQGMHEIQLAVEDYAVDHSNAYPDYLIGGAAAYSDGVDFGTAQKSGSIKHIADLQLASDCLLRNGYVTQYPKNPFTKGPKALHDVQRLFTDSRYDSDPLRNGHEAGKTHGTRFGPDCNLMGGVLADIRFPRMTVESNGSTHVFDTGADVVYDYWDMWQGEKPLPYLPGMFYYKSLNPTVYPSGIDMAGTDPPAGQAFAYVLGAYGWMRNKGQDVLGDESPITIDGSDYWYMLRSINSSEANRNYGCPIKVEESKFFPANPNGIRDSIIITLTSNKGREE